MAQQSAVLAVERQGLQQDPLGRTFRELQRSCQLPCYNPKCPLRLPFNQLTDNARVDGRFYFVKINTDDTSDDPGGEVKEVTLAGQEDGGMREKTPKDLLHRNTEILGQGGTEQVIVIVIKCHGCGVELSRIAPTDSEEKLFLDIRGVLTNDLTLPLLFLPGQSNLQLPDDAKAVCELAHRPAVDQFILSQIHRIQHLIKDTLEEARGELMMTLIEKGKAAAEKFGDSKMTYIRIGVGLLDLEPHTAILELWPKGYRSPKHHHGGCAGSVRVVYGRLKCKLFESMLSEEPRTFKNGHCGLQGLPVEGTQELTLSAGETTWLNRQNNFVHQVECHTNDTFALSLHLYKSCTDEFAFDTGRTFAKGSPKNDYFWNVDLPAEHPKAREVGREGMPRDFVKEVLDRPALRRALKQGDAAMHQLWEQEKDKMHIDRYGRNFLHYAVQGYKFNQALGENNQDNKDNRDTVNKMVELGMDLNLRDRENKTPLAFAIQKAMRLEIPETHAAPDFLKLLLEKRADHRSVAPGKSALQFAEDHRAEDPPPHERKILQLLRR